MATSSPKSIYLRGIVDSLPFLLVVIPFALLFGVVAVEAGLRLPEIMGFSVLVIAGAAQLAALQLMRDDAPTLIILATALAINLRMAMYSAAITPYLGQAKLWQRALIAYFLVDQSYVQAHAKYEAEPDMPLSARLAYFAGVVTPVAPAWYAASLAGALVGKSIPPQFALDFGLPITFLAMTAPMLRTIPHLAAAVTSVTMALLLAWMPYGTGLLLAAVAAMLVGAEAERRLTLRRKGAAK